MRKITFLIRGVRYEIQVKEKSKVRWILRRKNEMKMALAVAREFSCLSSDVQIKARGIAHTPAIAARRAVEKLFTAPELSRKRVRSVKISITFQTLEDKAL